MRLATIFKKKERDCVGLELDISILKGWAQVNVAYQDVYIIENMAVVTHRSTSMCVFFLSYIVQDMTIKTHKHGRKVNRDM